MTVVHNSFVNPADGTTYTWPRNHETENSPGKTRNYTTTGPTNLVGLIQQQGADSPYMMRLSGKIFHRSQLQAFWAWFELSRTQTIHFHDFDGQQSEVQIQSFTPVRVRKLSLTGPDPTVPNHYWSYDLEMRVFRFIAGDMVGVAP